jgi:hypothetical protein
MINNTRPMTDDDLARYFRTLSDDALRTRLRYYRSSYRHSASTYNRDRALRRHSLAMTELRARNLT